MTDTPQPGDVVRILHPWKPLWCAYVFGRRKSALQCNHPWEYGVRFTDWDRGLHWFFFPDLEEEILIPFLEPVSQAGEGKGRRKRRKYDFPSSFDDEPLPEPIPEPTPSPTPSPEPTPPEPQPSPEPTPEPEIRMRIKTSEGQALIVGDWLAPSVTLTLIDPYGNSYQTRAGNKSEYGAGGFEFIPWAGPGLYTLIAGGREFSIPMAGGFTRLLFERGVEEMVRLVSVPMDEARAQWIMARWPGLGFEVVRG